MKSYFFAIPLFAISSFVGVGAQAEQPVIRVLLLEAKTITFRADEGGGFFIEGIESEPQRVGSVKLLLQNDQIKYSLGNGLNQWKTVSKRNSLRAWSTDPRGLWVGGRRYGGKLLISERGNQLMVVNHVRIEKYLKSVVGGEMPKTWPLEALKAQAVAARTYVLNKNKKIASYDVKASNVNQVYLGIESETNSTRKAVDKTRALVLTHKGKLIESVFHSSSGGRTEYSGSVWKKQKPYLVSVADFDQSSPFYSWKKRIGLSQLKESFSEIGGLNAMRILSTSTTGRIQNARLYGPKGTIDLTGGQIRQRLNLRSTLFKFNFIQNKSINTQNLVSKWDLPSKENAKRFNELVIQPLPPIFGKTSPPALPPVPLNHSLLVQGSGSGHGVGMSQWGAKGMASNGSNYKEILRYYYKGTKLNPYSSRYKKS